MADDIFKKLGEIVDSFKKYLDEEIERRVEKKLAGITEILAEKHDDESYDQTPGQIARMMSCGRDKIIEYVHSGVLRGCFIKIGTHYKFKRLASKRAIEEYTQREVYSD